MLSFRLMHHCGRRISAHVYPCCSAAPWAAPITTLRARMHTTSSPEPGMSISRSTAIPSTDAQMQREIFRKAMASSDTQDPTPPMESLGAEGGFTEERSIKLGSSDEDAFGHTDPLMAVEQTVHGASTGASQQASKGEVETTSLRERKDELANEIDQVVSSRNRRRNRRKRSMDAILGDVLHDALRMRDLGEKPTTDFVYKRAQERMYEEEYGKKPPTAKEAAAQYIPYPPDFHMHRLLPLFDSGTAAAAAETVAPEPGPEAGAVGVAPRLVKSAPACRKNYMHVHALVPPDPWPERSVTPENPVWTRRDVEEDRQKSGGKGLKEWEERMFAPRPNYDLSGEFLDAMDELAHWERHLLTFLRVVPISQRRSLPFLHEWYRLLVHRVVRAERRYIRIRNALLAQSKSTASVYARTEKIVEDVRGYYSETHRSLSSPNYDPLRMKKSVLAPILRMTDAEFEAWQEVQRQQRNALAAEFS